MTGGALPTATAFGMESRLLLVLVCALCGVCGATPMGGPPPADPPPKDEGASGPKEPAEPEEPGPPEDPRCKRVNSEADERDFSVFLAAFVVTGFFEESDVVVENGVFNGNFHYGGEMTAELPVLYKLEFKSGDTYQAVGGGFDSMQGLLEKFPNVVMCMNCYLNPKLELPMAIVEDGLAMADFELFPRLFPQGFPKGKYFVVINQTCEGLDEKYCGTIRVDFELKPNAD